MERAVLKLSAGSVSVAQLREAHSSGGFLAMCTLMSESQLWGSAVKNLSIPDAASRAPRVVYDEARDHAGARSTASDTVSVKYRMLLQKLNKYHELDRSRVKIFKDIYHMLTEAIQQPSEGAEQCNTAAGPGMKSGDINETTGALCLSSSAINRLLDNLWTGASLVEVPNKAVASSTSKRKSSPKGKGSTKAAGITDSSHISELTGMGILRAEYDQARQQYGDALQFTASHAAFLKWASSAAATSLTLEDLLVSLPAQWAHSTMPVKGSLNTTGTEAHEVASAAATAEQEATRLGNLYKAVSSAVPMMADLEGCMYDLLGNHALSAQELWAASAEADAKYASMGLTVADIDAYFDSSSAAGDDTGGYEENVDRKVNLFELLDSQYHCSTAIRGSGGMQAATSWEGGDELRRLVQQELRVSIDTAEPQLQMLRQHNRDTLDRVAKVSEKFSPFAFVWASANK
jgi:hypothetical protein